MNILVTGSSGWLGQTLVPRLARDGHKVVGLDPEPGPTTPIVGSVVDRALVHRIIREHGVEAIVHAAARHKPHIETHDNSEFVAVNVQGTLNLLHLAVDEARSLGHPVKFLFPSSIAVYGFASREAKHAAGRVAERAALEPVTMYGCNKLYCEHLGRYFAKHYRQLAAGEPSGVDFRAIRFPGLLSAFTLPSGGTSDYAPEMIHAAAQGRPYACFVREDTRIPFMAMPDAIAALLALLEAPAASLTGSVYNVAAFNPSAGELADLVQRAFPDARITFVPDPRRQAVIDSWPEDVDDSRARRDWGFRPAYDLKRAFEEYLTPNIRRRYPPR